MNDHPMSRYGVYILFLLVLVPVLLLRDFTPANELRYVSIAADALRDGNFLTFTNQGLPYADKPPLYLWIVMGAYSLLGTDCMWLVGIFSAIPAIFVVELTIRMFGERIPGSRRLALAVMMLTCTLFLAMSFTLRMDMLMTLFIVGAIYCFMHIHNDRRGQHLHSWQWWVGIMVFIALFTKGPLGVLIPLLALVVFLLMTQNISRFGKYWGWRCWVVLLVGCLLWWGGAWLEGGNEYMQNLLFHQTVDRAVDAFHHKRPWFYYLVQMWWCLAPWSLALVGILLATILGAGRDTRSPEQVMCLSVVIPTFIMLSVISSKLAVYLLPVIPFWVCSMFMATDVKGSVWQRWLIGLPLFVLALVGLSGAIGIWIPQLADRFVPEADLWSRIWVSCAGLAMAAGTIAAVIRLFGRKASMDMAIRNGGLGLLVALLFAGLAMPAFNHLIGLDKVGLQAAAFSKDVNPDKVYTIGMDRSENLDVYFGKPVVPLGEVEDFTDIFDKSQEKSSLVICYAGALDNMPEASVCLVNRVDDKAIYYFPPIPVKEEEVAPEEPEKKPKKRGKGRYKAK